MSRKLVWCKTKKQFNQVVKELRKRGCVFDDPDSTWNTYKEETVIRVYGNGSEWTYASRQWYKKTFHETPIMAEEFLGEIKKNPAIVVYRRGNTVTALDKNTGNKGVAKCSPDDTFNYYTGASIAMARLMALSEGGTADDAEKAWYKVFAIPDFVVEDNTIHEGNKVRVKEGCTGDRYDSYYDWLKKHITNVDLILGYERNDDISTEDVYTVIKIAPHESLGNTLAYIMRNNGFGGNYCYLFDMNALEKA